MLIAYCICKKATYITIATLFLQKFAENLQDLKSETENFETLQVSSVD